LIFDSKEPVEFWLLQLTTVLALHNTNTIPKQINELVEGVEYKYMIACHTSSDGLRTIEDHKESCNLNTCPNTIFNDYIQEMRGSVIHSMYGR
jgi:hypothetical protein